MPLYSLVLLRIACTICKEISIMLKKIWCLNTNELVCKVIEYSEVPEDSLRARSRCERNFRMRDKSQP